MQFGQLLTTDSTDFVAVAGPGTAEPRGPATLAVAPADSLDVDALAAALAAGAVGAILTAATGPDDLDRLAARLDVAEAMLGRAPGAALAGVVLADPAAVLAFARAAARPGRAAAVGLDEAALAARLGVAGGAAALASARGLVVLAARAVGASPFRVAGPDGCGPGALEAAAREGFAAVLVPR